MKFKEQLYIAIIVIFSGGLYYLYVYDGYYEIGITLITKVKLVLFNFTIGMFYWSMIATIAKDPGMPPVFWGHYLNEPENRKKRYCLVCHVFKPERCHHCSTC